MSFQIGNVTIEHPVIIAPMAGVSTRAFRTIAREFGAGLVCNEMVSDKALFYGSDRTRRMLRSSPDEHPLSFQIFGHDKESILHAAKILDQETECDIIDFNMGCPVNKVIKAKAGSWLLQDIDYAYDLVKSIVESVSKPVTIKMRIGFDVNHINVVEMAKAMEKAGAAALIIHGRTRSQFYEGHADWSWIKKVKEAVSIPVIGNGDVKSVEDMKAMMEQTGCDGVMIGRGVVGNPFLIQECVDEFTGENHSFTLEQRLAACKKHARLLMEDLDEKDAIRQMRGLATWYVKGLPHSHFFKEQLSKMNTYADLESILDAFYQKQLETSLLQPLDVQPLRESEKEMADQTKENRELSEDTSNSSEQNSQRRVENTDQIPGISEQLEKNPDQVQDQTN